VTEPLARAPYPESFDRLAQFVELLRTDGVARGLIGPNEGPRLWERHIVNCAVVAECIPPAAKVVDMGTGAGLPGLVVALVRPDLTVSLVDTQVRRVAFVSEAIAALGLEPRCQATQARFPKAWGVEVPLEADVLLARGLAPLPDLVEMAWPAIARGAELLALKGSGAEGEIDCFRVERPDLALKCHVELIQIGLDEMVTKTTVVRLSRG
jgi:16S rRNA (guanine527-N7)-methyltransferase